MGSIYPGKIASSRDLLNPISPKSSKKKPLGARAVALACLMDLEKGRFPEAALEEHAAHLDRRDRALAAALVYGVLRWRSRLDWILGRYLRYPDKPLPGVVLAILELGLFQLIYLDRVPASAAVNEAVNLARKSGPPWSPKLVNGILRRIDRAERLPEPADFDLPPEETLALTQAHPVWLVRRWIDELGLEETGRLLEANNVRSPLTLRVNIVQAETKVLADLLAGRVASVEKAAYSPEGLVIQAPTGPISDLPGYAEGWFSVQDEAAQVISHLVDPHPGEKILDACAGQGGKTFHLAALLHRSGGAVWGLDSDGFRLKQAQAEQSRLRSESVHLVQADLMRAPFRPRTFDAVLVDAPCSNLGVIRRRPDIKWLKSSEDSSRLAERQIRLLISAARLVKPGGRLVYAVCTLTREETTGVIHAFEKHHAEFSLRPAGTSLPKSAGAMVSPDGFLRAWPHRHGTDGFFAAVLERSTHQPDID